VSDRLWFERLELERLPGLERGGFTLDGLSPGVNVIHGPNGSGKTTTARAIHSLLWPESGAPAGRRLRAALRIGGEPWEIELDHDRQLYRAGGERADRPVLPPADVSDRYHLTLQDLLATEGAAGTSGQRFARQIAEELAGGFDFESARAAVHARPAPGRPKKLIDRYGAAKAKVREVEETQRRLLDEEAELGRLRRELAASREAARKLEMVQAQSSWLDAREAADEAARRLASYPAAMERLVGDEADRVTALEQRVRDERQALERVRERTATEERRREAARLPPEGLSDEVLEVLRRRSETLEHLEDQLEREADRLTRACERQARARRGLSTGDAAWQDEAAPASDGGEPAPPDLPAWQEVVDLARRWEIHRGETAQVARVEEWIGRVETATTAERLDRLRDATRILRRWLRRPGGAWRPRLPALAAALALAGAGVYAILVGFDPLWGGASAGSGLVVLVWMLLERHSARRQRAELAAEYEALRRGDEELVAPGSWTAAEVAGALDDLERDLSEVRLEEEKAVRWHGLAGRRDELAQRGAALARERDALLDRLGALPALGSEVDPAPLASFVEALAVWREATTEVTEAEAARAMLLEKRGSVLESIARELEALGDGAPEDAIEAASRIASLRDRAGEHRRAGEALAALVGAEGERSRVEARLREAEEGLAAIYRALDLRAGDRTGLARLLERFDDYRAAGDAAREAQWRRTEAEAALARLGGEPAEGPEGAAQPGEVDRATLEAEGERLAARAGEVEALIRRLQDLETRIRAARGGHDLEDALAELDAAEQDLRRARDAEARKVVAWRLTAWLRSAAGRSHRPVVLRQATDLFARFTRGRYELLDPEGVPPVFRAREGETGLVRRLDELSAGTRVQLLIAVRLAFAESQERGLRLPLVLDETLANSDEWAAEAVMEALLEVAGPDGGVGGRQVLYFTAQHDEVAKWQAALAAHEEASPPAVVDLGRLRQWQRAAERPRLEVGHSAPEPPPEPPAKTRSASTAERRAEYARALDVPGLDPWSGPGGVHLWYLVDSPDALHTLLSRDIEHWGQLQTLGRASAERLLGGGKEGEEGEERWLCAAARARCLGVLFAAWREGRGKPVDRGVLLASGAVNADTFLDKIADLARDLGGDAAALVAALRERSDERTKGFLNKKTEELVDYLAAEGFLDERPRLGPDGLEQRALAALGQEIAEGRLSVAEIRELIAGLPES